MADWTDPIGQQQAANTLMQSQVQLAAFGDAQQTARIQNRLARMVAETGIDEQMKDTKWKQEVANMLTGVPAAGTAPQAPPTPPASGAPPTMITGNTIGNGLMMPGQTNMSLNNPPQPQESAVPAAPGVPPTAPQTSADPYAAILQSTSPGGQLYQQDPVRALALNDQVKVKQSTQMWDQLKIGVETNRIDAEKQKLIQEKMEPIIRATTPVLQEYDKLLAKGMKPAEAQAAVQPHYEQMIAAVSQIPGYEQAAAGAPKQFSPALAYLATDTYKMLGQQQTTKEKEAVKLDEQKRSGMVTPAGKIIFTDGRGRQFVDGKEYTGKAIKPKVGAAGGGVGIPTEGQIGHALKAGKLNDAVEFAAQYLAFYGKLPPGMGRSKGGDAVREKAFARVSEIAKEANMTLPQLFAAGADVKANVAAMIKQKGLMTITQSNEAQAEKNLTRLEGLYDKLGNGTIPVLNGVMNRFKKGLGAPEPGTAEAVAYETMIEYTKVVTGQTTGAAPTDSAMKNTADLINVIKDNPAMIKQKFKEFRGLMKDKLLSQQVTYDNLKASLGQGVTAQGPAPQAPVTPSTPTGLNINQDALAAELARRGIK